MAASSATCCCPTTSLPGLEGATPRCNCGRIGDLESVCSLTAIRNLLLPHFLPGTLGTNWEPSRPPTRPSACAAWRERGDAMCREIFQVQARALGMFFDQMVNVFDPDALIVGGGAIEASPEFQQWFVREIRAGMPTQRAEQADIPIHLMPNGDSAGARGAALDALAFARAATFAR